MVTRTEQLFNQLHTELNGELLQTQARLTQLMEANEDLCKANARLMEERDRLLQYNTAAQDTINSLTSQAEHWKRECEKHKLLWSTTNDRCINYMKRLSTIWNIVDGAMPPERATVDTELGEVQLPLHGCDNG